MLEFTGSISKSIKTWGRRIVKRLWSVESKVRLQQFLGVSYTFSVCTLLVRYNVLNTLDILWLCALWICYLLTYSLTDIFH